MKHDKEHDKMEKGMPMKKKKMDMDMKEGHTKKMVRMSKDSMKEMCPKCDSKKGMKK